MDPKSMQFAELVDLLHKKNFVEADRCLREDGELLRFVDTARRMAVHYAAGGGHLDLVRRELGRDPGLASVEDDEGWTLLQISSSAGQLEIVRLLMDFGIDVNHRINGGQSALHFACSKNHLTTAQLLIEKGADLNVQDERGATPLHKAASQGHQRIVNLLLGCRNKLQIDLPNREGDTALHLACEDQRMEVALLLARSGASIEKKNLQNQTPIDLVEDKEQRLKLVKASESVKPTAGT